MRRLVTTACLVVVLGACSPVSSPSPEGATATTSQVPLPGGRLVYGRFYPSEVLLFTANTDGTHEQPLLSQDAELPRWAPDGRRLSVSVHSPQGLIFVGLVNPDGSDFVRFNSPDPTLQLGCAAWSPDGSRLVCEGWDNSDPTRTGIYTVRVADGADLTRVTTSHGSAHDIPGDYSPNGRQIAFIRIDPAAEEHGTLMVVDVDGKHERALTDRKVGAAGRWSPDGRTILSEADGSLLLVSVDGGQPWPIKIHAKGSAGRGAWSPDGEWIVFSLGVPPLGEDIYITRMDGTNLHQVTNTPGKDEEFADWG